MKKRWAAVMLTALLLTGCKNDAYIIGTLDPNEHPQMTEDFSNLESNSESGKGAKETTSAQQPKDMEVSTKEEPQTKEETLEPSKETETGDYGETTRETEETEETETDPILPSETEPLASPAEPDTEARDPVILPTDPPVTEPPATEPPATEPPATEPPATVPVTEPVITPTEPQPSETEPQSLPVEHVHTLLYQEGVESTCTQMGHAAYYYCATCGKMFRDPYGNNEISSLAEVETAKTAHSMVYIPANAATCVVAGNQAYYYCNICHNRYLDEAGTQLVSEADIILPASGHAMIHVTGKAATCTEAGEKDRYICSVCHQTFLDEAGDVPVENADSLVIAPLGHAMVFHDAGLPDCIHDGADIPYYECTTCGRFFRDAAGTDELTDMSQVKIPAYGHTMIYHEMVSPACTVSGHIAYYECLECGKLFLDKEGTQEVTDVETLILPATDHTWSEWQTDDTGTSRICTVCQTRQYATS